MFMTCLLVALTRLVVVAIFVASAAWTVFRAVLNLTPNAAANYFMDTGQLDDGDFWQLKEPESRILFASVVGLGLVAIVYVFLAVVVVLPAPIAKVGDTQRHLGPKKTEKQLTTTQTPTKSPRVFVISELKRALTFYHELVDLRGKYRKAWNLVMEIPELTFQTITLHGMLVNGLRPELVSWYVLLMAVNCVYSFYHITIAWRHHAFYEMVGDAMLDVVFAVAFPALTLYQTITDFRGNLSTIMIRQKYLPAQPYERRSRLYADAAQINLFTTAFETLQISNLVDCVVTVGFNLLTCLRWRRIVVMLHRKQHLQRRPSQVKTTSIVPLSPPVLATTGVRRWSHIRPQTRVVPAFVGFFFLIYGAVAAIYTYTAVSVSTKACAPVEHCVLHAHQWFPGAPNMACPCLVFIEGDLTQRMSGDEELKDASRELSVAAEFGALRTIQIVFRGLQGKLPPHVRGCSELRHLIVFYSDLQELPGDWFTTFTKLSYLHVRGKSDGINLESIPPSFFENAPSLRLLSLERHASLIELPPFAPSSPLELLFLSDIPSLHRLPSFEATPNLKTLALLETDMIAWLPDLTPIAKSLTYVSIVQASLCCSGFLSQGRCNESNPSCWMFIDDEYDDTCYPSETDIENNPSLVIGSSRFPVISNSSLAVLQPFLDLDVACNKTTVLRLWRGFKVDACEGVLYRECLDGICYSFTDANPSCVEDQAIIDMRKTEISYGFPCDPVEEAWLGCV